MTQPRQSARFQKKLILASASPRRRELLSQMGLQFDIIPADCDEHAVGAPEFVVESLAKRKADCAAEKINDGLIIAADTLVVLGEAILGKPDDPARAVEMLRSLSGKTHRVMTGVCVKDATNGRAVSAVDISTVSFRALSDQQIADYVATGEPMDKAGAYAIQGGAAAFVESYLGAMDNIIGLPCALLKNLLNQFEETSQS